MSEKTEEPTDKKLRDAKQKGQGPKSTDIVAAAVLIISLLGLIGMGGAIYERLSSVIKLGLGDALQAKTNQAMAALATQMLMDALWAALPLVVLSVLAATVALFAQVGVVISFEGLTPKFDKLNPAEGVKKIFSVRSLIEFVKSIFKAVALGWVLWISVKGMVPLLVGAAYLPLSSAALVAWHSMLDLLGVACLVFVVIAPIDFGLQRFLFIKDQRMSKDDIKREHKEADGDPQMKGQRKAMAHEINNSPPQQKVPGASVVVTNPTHFAVALRYDPETTPVPVVVAKGADEAAALIRQIAAQHGVPIVGNPPLARALFKLPLEHPIPAALFDAVAVVLRWVAELERVNAASAAEHAAATPGMPAASAASAAPAAAAASPASPASPASSASSASSASAAAAPPSAISPVAPVSKI
jgi:type III secretion protein U